MVVRQIEIKEKTITGGNSWKYYDCLVQGFENTDNIHILHESEEGKYNKYLKVLSTDAASEKDVSRRIKKWKDFFSFKDNFADVNYAYCITAHNSQGSTYENAFVMYSDILLNRREDERKRIMYTAMTRPRKMLYII